MKNRSKMKKSKSKKLFRKTADRVHKFNMAGRPMRGGTRL